MDFYDFEPDPNGHYLCKNGKRVARFNDLKTAEAVRERYIMEEAERFDTYDETKIKD
jgi:hypothetical protein